MTMLASGTFKATDILARGAPFLIERENCVFVAMD